MIKAKNCGNMQKVLENNNNLYSNIICNNIILIKKNKLVRIIKHSNTFIDLFIFLYP